MTFTTTIANATLDALHPTSGTKTLGTLTITYPIKIRLIVGSSGSFNSTVGSAGTELSTGGSYTAGTGISIGANWAAASSGTQSSNAAVSQTNMPAATVLGVEFWDSSGTPQRLEFGTMTSKTTQAGDTLSFASGAITSALS